MNKVNLYNQFKNNPLSYRDKLTIPKDINFGLEIELEDVDFDKVSYRVDRQFGGTWQVKTDRSLKTDNNAELVSPVLRNTKETWKMIREMGRLLQRIQPTFENCSFQVNFDSALLPTLEDKISFLKLFALYEDIIFRFSMGEDGSYRSGIKTYANPIALTLKSYLENNNEQGMIDAITNHKKDAVIFKDKTAELIEFRTPNGSSNIVLWQNYVTLFYYLIMYAKSNKWNEVEAEKYLEEFNTVYMLHFYERLNVDKALDFSSKVLTKSIDQSFFMQQYIGKDIDSLQL